MKKILPLLILGATCLASCGDNSISGVYKFALGRQGPGQMRIGIEMDLKDSKYVVPESAKPHYSEDELKAMENAKDFSLKLDLGDDFEKIKKESEIIKTIFEALNIENGLKGYYIVLDEKDEKYGQKMALGFDFDLSSLGLDIPVPAELIQNFVVSYAGNNKITLQMPVSVVDLQCQLCWYSGSYYDFDPYVKSKIHDLEDLAYYLPDIIRTFKIYDLEEFSALPGTKDGNTEIKRFGSHPVYIEEDDKVVKDEAGEMNQLYAGLFSNTLVYSVDDSGNKDKLIGSIYEDGWNEKVVQNFFDLDLKNPFLPAPTGPANDYSFSCFIEEPATLLHEKRDVKVKMTVLNSEADPKDHTITRVECDGAQYTFEDKELLNLTDFMVDPFEFRDFHDIKLQLSKE